MDVHRARANGDKEIIQRVVAEQLGDGFLRLPDAQPPQLFLEEVPATLDILCTLLPPEPVPDLSPGVGCFDVPQVLVQPVEARPLARLDDDLHRVAVLELMVEGDHLAVDLSSGTAVAEVGVDAVGEVDGRCARRQLADLALGRIHEDLVWEDVGLHRLEEVLGPWLILVPLEELAHPRHLLFEFRVAVSALFVPPVCGNAVLRDLMHAIRANLHLEGGYVRS